MASDEYDESELTRALQAPGTTAELADEERYLAMFRAAHADAADGVVVPMAGARRTVRRLGAGTTIAVMVALATGGVAAAYSSNLPDPVQRAVHSVLAPLGVPEPDAPEPVARKPRAPETTPPVVVPVVPGPSATPSRKPGAKPSPSATPTEVLPSTDPSASPTDLPSPSTSPDPTGPTDPSGSPTTSPTPDPIVPSSVSISSGAGHQVSPGATAVVSGQVVGSDGAPMSGVRVVLQQNSGDGWRRVTEAKSGSDGSVAMATGPIQRTTDVRFVAAKVRSAAWRLTVQPSMSASSQPNSVTASAHGAQPGDQVVLLARRDGQLVQESESQLDGSGSVRFTVPASEVDQWYVVRLPATAAHGSTQARVKVKGTGTTS